jgi:hypothetical protein
MILREKDELGEKVGRCNVVAPIEGLPFEILQLIFRLDCRQGRDLNTEYLLWESSKDPATKFPVFRLMSVCSAWRQIVLKTPELWSTVCRAGNIPRKLNICVRCGHEVNDVRNIISQYPFRILKCRFEYFSDPPMNVKEIQTESLLPLEELEILEYCESHVAESIFSAQPFPNLWRLRIRGPFDVQWLVSAPRPALRQLLLFNGLTPLSLSSALASLCHAPALDKVAMTISVKEERSLLGNIVASNLSLLDVCFTSSRNGASFLESLTLPRLTSLMINKDSSKICLDCDISVFRQLGARSGTELEEIVISGTTSPLSVGELLDWMPSLRRLQIHAGGCVFDAGSRKRMASGNLGPCLEVFSIPVTTDSPSDVEPIIAMVESRQGMAQSEGHGPKRRFEEVRLWMEEMGYKAIKRKFGQRISQLKVLKLANNTDVY